MLIQTNLPSLKDVMKPHDSPFTRKWCLCLALYNVSLGLVAGENQFDSPAPAKKNLLSKESMYAG
jgi:hypothetical protein